MDDAGLPLPNILSRVANTPLMILPDKAEVIWSVVEAKMLGRLPETLGDPSLYRSRRMMSVHSGVAVIDVHGTLVQRTGAFDSFSGLTSYQAIRAELETAMASPEVKAILLDIDSPGGEAAGAFDLADAIREASKSKPIDGLAEDQATSAAYLLLAACRKAYSTQLGTTGSVGVYTLHRNLAAYYAKEGVEHTEIIAGAEKAYGSPVKALSAEALARIKERATEIRDHFAERVAMYRSLTRETVLATEAAVYLPAASQERRLIDGVRTFEQLIAELSAESEGSLLMPDETTTPAANQPGTVTLQLSEDGNHEAMARTLASHFPGAVTHIRQAERTRLQQIRALALPGQSQLAEKLSEDPEMTEGRAAMVFLAHQRERLGAQRTAANDDEVELSGLLPSAPAPERASATGKVAVVAQDKESLQAAWKASTKLQAEFPRMDAFVTYATNHPEVLQEA